VLLIDPELDETTTVTAGTVVGHGPDKEKMYRQLLKLKATHTALLWTGVIRGLVRFAAIEVED